MPFCHHKLLKKLHIYVQVREKEKQEQVDCLASSQFSTIRLRQIILAVKQEYNCKNHPKIIFC